MSVLPDFYGSRVIPTFMRSLNTLHWYSHVICVLISLTSTLTLCRCTGHKWADTFVDPCPSLQHCVDAQDMSKHIGAHPCPLCIYSVPSTPCGHTRHKWAHWCSPVSCMSLSLSHWCCGDTLDMSKHISACPCPYLSLWHHMDAQDTSTPVLACVLCVLMSVSSDAQNMSEHISACLCSVCQYPCPFDTVWMHWTWVSTVCSLMSCVLLSLYLWLPRT